MRAKLIIYLLSLEQRAHGVLDHAVILRHLPVGRDVVDELRQNLREPAGNVASGHTKMAGDFGNFVLPEHIANLIAADGHVLAFAHP